MKKEIRPIIKWTGGKFNEFDLFSSSIPKFERYIEPFFGGGGVFFALQPEVSSLINDKSLDLINFYQQVGNPEFQHELSLYAEAWDQLGNLSNELWSIFKESFATYIGGGGDINQFKGMFIVHLTASLKKFSLLNQEDFVVDPSSFLNRLAESLVDKAKRIKRISDSERRNFDIHELKEHFETGLRSGAYLYFRSILNASRRGSLILSVPKAVANWYFVREFCYGSMFRFNSKGEFNIPYGGISYNRKNLRQKIAKIFREPIVSLFKSATISNLDFEAFLSNIDLGPNDFIFLDPPYDSEFSEYDRNAFTPKDQKRLADFLKTTSAKWMVVIKETDYILKIYDDPSVRIKVFYKNYTYNIRGRNNRSVKHLIITNY